MGSDMVVALARATADGHALFGHNCNRPAGAGMSLVRAPGRAHAPGEKIDLGGADLPQVRQTLTVLGCRPAGEWGYVHGVNDHGVALGATSLRTKLAGERPGLSGSDLVRLTLERATCARQAVDVLTDLVGRHGQADPAADGSPRDNSFLVADGDEAFVLETAGAFWAEQAVGTVRAVSDVCHLRQDWDRIAPGLADRAIERGWWPANGSKLDFAGAVGQDHGDAAASLRRWGKATRLLEEHSGQIDLPFLRRLLSDHSEAPGLRRAMAPSLSLCQHASGPDEACTSASLVVHLREPRTPPVAWWAFGSPCTSVWFPLLLTGDLPTAFEAEGAGGAGLVWRRMTRLAAEALRSPDGGATLREALAGLQEQIDQEAREFLAEADACKGHEEEGRLHRLAGSLMQHHLERWENVCDEVCPPESRLSRVPNGSGYEYAAARD